MTECEAAIRHELEHVDFLRRMRLHAALQLGTTEEAREVIQSVALEALKQAHNLKMRHAVRAWLWRILQSEIAQHIVNRQKSRRYTGEMPEYDKMVSGDHTPEHQAIQKQEAKRNKLKLAKAVFGMKSTDRMILKLTFVQGNDAETLARMMGLPSHHAAELRKSKAKQRLAKLIDQTEL